MQIHVNGAAGIYLAPGGTGLDPMGYSEDGVSLDFNFASEDVMCDIYGPRVPIDVQYFLQECFISFALVMYDDDIFDEMMAQWAASLSGQMLQAGKLFLQQAGYFRLLIRSTAPSVGVTPNEPCYNFPYAIPVSVKGRHGSRRKIYDCVWRALPYGSSITGGNSVGTVLYNSTCT